jgi:hypothetical protein
MSELNSRYHSLGIAAKEAISVLDCIGWSPEQKSKIDNLINRLRAFLPKDDKPGRGKYTCSYCRDRGWIYADGANIYNHFEARHDCPKCRATAKQKE